MFWSLILEPGKRYSSTVVESFHLSMATLDIKSCKNDSEISPVSIEVDGQELLLCNLSKTAAPHANLDLVFQKGSDITFSTKGKAIVHLTGYCIQDDDEDVYSSSSELEEESDSDLVANAKKASGQLKSEGKSKSGDKQNANKRKLQPIEAVSKKKPKGGKVESDEDDSDDESADLDDNKLGQLVDSINTEDNSSDENDEDDSDIDDEEDEDSDNSEGEDEVDDDDDDDDEDEDDEEDESDSEDESVEKPTKKQDVKTPVSSKQKTPVSSKKHEKLSKAELTNGSTPQSNKKDKNKNQTNQATPKQAAQKTPKKGESTPVSQKKQTLNGGVVVEELKPGGGQPAKYGKLVQVYYTGRLKNNNRVFDQSTQGPGFKFRLGAGEVIKGWDVALNGMKVGGKRRVTIPPAMAYGNKGSPPQIPPNSWLVFDIELKSVS